MRLSLGSEGGKRRRRAKGEGRERSAFIKGVSYMDLEMGEGLLMGDE